MYNRFELAKKYLQYYLIASNGKGHGIHSPFVFDFIKNVLNKNNNSIEFVSIEKNRKELLHNTSTIEVEDFGAGSSTMKSKQRRIKDIARSSLKSKKYAALIARIGKYYNAQNIIELGTSLGITTSYIATANLAALVNTLEGAGNIAFIAQSIFDKLQLKNINITIGNFDKTLPVVLEKINQVDLAFIDGNHQKEPTIQYFEILLQKINTSSILIFDDIHWSAGMEQAWHKIKNNPAVTLSIDLFFIGLVFFKQDFRCKQHFVIRF